MEFKYQDYMNFYMKFYLLLFFFYSFFFNFVCDMKENKILINIKNIYMSMFFCCKNILDEITFKI